MVRAAQRPRSRLARLASSLLLACGLGAFAVPARAQVVVGLTNTNSLVTFDSATPGTASAPIPITGLVGTETLFDIDIRPATLQLYGLGSQSRLYTINPTTGAATLDSVLAGTLDPNATRFGI